MADLIVGERGRQAVEIILRIGARARHAADVGGEANLGAVRRSNSTNWAMLRVEWPIV